MDAGAQDSTFSAVLGELCIQDGFAVLAEELWIDRWEVTDLGSSAHAWRWRVVPLVVLESTVSEWYLSVLVCRLIYYSSVVSGTQGDLVTRFDWCLLLLLLLYVVYIMTA